MIRKFILPVLILYFSAIYSQDTIAYSDDSEIVDIKDPEAVRYKVMDLFKGEVADSIYRYYDIDGKQTSEITFNWDAKEEKHIYEGTHKYWYDSGKPFYTQSYKDGELHGPLVAFHENGKIKRRDRFKKGKFKNGAVWDENGNELEHFPHFIKPEFPGGIKNISVYLREHIRFPADIELGKKYRVVAQFRIDTLGKVEVTKIVEKPNEPFYSEETVRVLEAMPQWKPGESFGDKIGVMYSLPIVFLKKD